MKTTGKALALPLLALLLAALPSGRSARGADSGGIWIDVYQGEPVQYGAVLEDLATVRAIYLGERHGLARHHAMQAQLVADLAKRGLPLALGLEQMEASQQPHLDRYNRGQLDFEQLAEATAWSKRWRNYDQYRPVLEAARKAKAPVVALNAEAETICQVARSGGVERLPPELRKQLPAKVQLQDPAYEKLLAMQMMVHVAATPETLRPMIEAQIARDEAMAEAAAAFLKSEQGRGRTMIVLCGAGHVAYGLGLPTRVARRLPEAKDRVLLFSESGEVRLSPEEKAQARPVEITHQQLRDLGLPVADYLCVKPLEAGTARVRPGDCPNFRPSENGTVPLGASRKGDSPVFAQTKTGTVPATRTGTVPGPAERLSQEVRRILGSLKSTQYSHKTEIDERAGKYFCDCSGLACYVLQQKLPQHYKAIPKPARRARPLAEDFYKFFAALPDAPEGRDGWRQVARLADARPGDILAWQSKNPKTGSTGHVVVIDGLPARTKDGQIRIEIIDSTSRGHGSDTRKSGETGIGRGTMWFSVDDKGRPTGYRWSAAGGKLQQRPIAVGRAVETAAHRDTPPSEKP